MGKYYIDKTVTAKKAQQVLDLLNNTPNGIVIDADTILADLLENANFEVTGIAAGAAVLSVDRLLI